MMLYFWYNDVIKYKEDLNMSYTEAQKKASIKYISQKTDDIRLRVPKGLKDKYKYEAEKRGISMTQFIVNCVEKEIKNG
jgi:predicted HicB family RNase H-like nuclease